MSARPADGDIPPSSGSGARGGGSKPAFVPFQGGLLDIWTLFRSFGLKLALFIHQQAKVRDEQAKVRDGLAKVRDGLAKVRDGLAKVRDEQAMVRDGLAMVCDEQALVCDEQALVCDEQALVRDGQALVRDGLANRAGSGRFFNEPLPVQNLFFPLIDAGQGRFQRRSHNWQLKKPIKRTFKV
jgi:hypothetical protein